MRLTVSKLARQFGLSRTALLYYDRVGLLPPSGRTTAGYRYYTDKDARKLDAICRFRRAGLTLADIRAMLAAKGKPRQGVFERRWRALEEQILDLRSQQTLLVSLMKGLATGAIPAKVDKAMWVEMLRAAGLDEQAMARWHAEYEKRAPDAHQVFLASLGILEPEIARIRQWSQEWKPETQAPSSARTAD
jgi:MerR family transcriptional regulator, thiopeptide resistance regulator